MTPDRIDRDTIGRRLRLMQEALATLRDSSSLVTGHLASDPIARAATERLVQVIVDLALDINGHLVVVLLGRAPETGRRSFLDMAEAGVLTDELVSRLAPAAGLRNVLVHHYVDIDARKVADAVPQLLADMPEYVTAVARFARQTNRG